MTDEEIETLRVAGDVTLVLKHGSAEERASLLDYIELNCGVAERLRLEQWMADGMPDA